MCILEILYSAMSATHVI